jgi:hypothetical protein
MKGIGFTLVSTHAGADDIAAKGDQIIADAKTLGSSTSSARRRADRREGQARLGKNA